MSMKNKMMDAFESYHKNLSNETKSFLIYIFGCNEISKNSFYFSLKHFIEYNEVFNCLDEIMDSIKSANRSFNTLNQTSISYSSGKRLSTKRIIANYKTKDALLVQIKIEEDFAEWYIKNIKGDDE